MPEVQAQLRCLDPHVLSLLGQVHCAALPQAALAPAALLMEELHGKLVEAMSRARRPAFLNAAAAQDQPTGELYANHSQLDRCLQMLYAACCAPTALHRDAHEELNFPLRSSTLIGGKRTMCVG